MSSQSLLERSRGKWLLSMYAKLTHFELLADFVTQFTCAAHLSTFCSQLSHPVAIKVVRGGSAFILPLVSCKTFWAFFPHGVSLSSTLSHNRRQQKLAQSDSTRVSFHSSQSILLSQMLSYYYWLIAIHYCCFRFRSPIGLVTVSAELKSSSPRTWSDKRRKRNGATKWCLTQCLFAWQTDEEKWKRRCLLLGAFDVIKPKTVFAGINRCYHLVVHWYESLPLKLI
jgi:hypothetical protein